MTATLGPHVLIAAGFIPADVDVWWVLGAIALVLAFVVAGIELLRGHWFAAFLWCFICVVLPYAGPIAWWVIRRDGTELGDEPRGDSLDDGPAGTTSGRARGA